MKWHAGMLLLIASVAWADTAPVPENNTPYKDRILSQDTLAVFADEQPVFDGSGLPRSLNLEWLSYYNRQNGESQLDQGLAIQRFWQTASMGEFSLDGVGLYNNSPDHLNDQRWQGRLTLWQRNFFINNNWRSNNGLGVLYSPLPALLRAPSRIFLPATGLLGLSSELQHGQRRQNIQLAAGKAGALNGRQVAGFETGDGNVYALNTEQQLAGNWRSAVALLQNTPDDHQHFYTNTPATQPATGRSALLALNWQQASQSMQFNLLSSRHAAQQTFGGWIDGHYRSLNTDHQYGWYYLQPDLNWGGQAMQQNAHGSYYRFNHDAVRWVWSGGLDYLQAIEGQHFNGLYANQFIRYQAGPRLNYGTGTTIRYGDSDRAFGQQLFIEKQHAYGQSKAQLDYNRIPQQQFDSVQLALDHAFLLPQDQRLSLNVSYQQLRQPWHNDQIIGLSAYGGINLSNTVSVDGSARWSRSLQQGQQSVGLNLTANWQLHPHWQLSTTLYQDQSRFEPDIIFDPLQQDLRPARQTQNQLSVLLSLRFQQRAGTAAQIMAGPAGSATGSIRGSVFLDENRDGIRSASERGAAQVTVLLNDRYSVRTNELGEFEFPAVAVGMQQIRVMNEELPLPWYFEQGSLQKTVQVNVRQSSSVEMGAVRMR